MPGLELVTLKRCGRSATDSKQLRTGSKVPMPYPETHESRPKGETPITRRDFLGSILLASGAVLLGGITPAELFAAQDEFTGYGGVGEYGSSNGNTLDVLVAGHSIRNGLYNPLPNSVIDTGESY